MQTLGIDFWTRALDELCAAFAEAEVRLCGYDGAIGDGDHGTSMLGGFRKARESCAAAPPAGCGDLFSRMGQAFVENVGGVTGIVFGSMSDAALARAARAAESGMEATIPMEAKVGRARYQAGKGAGHVDAGAASVCLVFQTLARVSAAESGA